MGFANQSGYPPMSGSSYPAYPGGESGYPSQPGGYGGFGGAPTGYPSQPAYGGGYPGASSGYPGQSSVPAAPQYQPASTPQNVIIPGYNGSVNSYASSGGNASYYAQSVSYIFSNEVIRNLEI